METKTLNYQGTILQLDLNPANPFGVEKIKETIRFVGGVFQDIKTALSDGKVTWLEGLRIGLELSGIRSILTSLEQMKDELTDLTESELYEVANEAISAFGINTSENALDVLHNKVIPTLYHVIQIVQVWTTTQPT